LIFSKKNERLQLRFPELMLADLFPWKEATLRDVQEGRKSLRKSRKGCAARQWSPASLSCTASRGFATSLCCALSLVL
jgi:hypothetical protein